MNTDARLRAIESGLEALGYDRDWIEYDYPIFVSHRELLQTRLVAFNASRPKDITTSSIVCGVANQTAKANGLFSAAHALAAPAVMLAVEEALQVWPTSRPPPSEPAVSVPMQEPSSLGAHKAMLGPRQLSEAKSGARQLTLFPVDVDLLGEARLLHADKLSKRVEDALAAVFGEASSAVSSSSKVAPPTPAEAARIVTGALAALALQDKVEYKIALDPSNLVDSLRVTYPDQFGSIADSSRARGLLSAALDRLRDNINYRALSPELLADVYEETLVTEALRRDLGIHYTPHDLAARIVLNIPFEALPPERRIVLDPTCGSGSLLLAAHDRLEALSGPHFPDEAALHSQLKGALHGLDKDPFAVEIARLCLFLKALPRGDGWDVGRGDALGHDWSELYPGVILSNPPWRKRGWQPDVAADFVLAFLNHAAPGTFLGLVLPVTWLQSRASHSSRAALKEACDVLEIWRLPEGTFTGAQHAPAVVIAQKSQTSSETSGTYWLFKRAVSNNSQHLAKFYADFEAPLVETYLVEPMAPAVPWITGALSQYMFEWSGPRLESVCHIAKGQQPLPESSRPRRKKGTHLFLGAARSLGAFEQVSHDGLECIQFPEDFQARRAAEFLDRPKVLVPATRSASNPWRLKVGLAGEGIAVTNSLFMLLPHEGVSLFGLMAYLGSMYASAWIDERAPGRNISIEVLREMPVMEGEAWELLDDLGRRIVTAEARRGDLLRLVDQIVAESLQLSKSVIEAVKRRFAPFEAPEGDRRYQVEFEESPSRPTAAWGFGTVLEAASGKVRVWVPGVTSEEGDWIQVPGRAPGWTCRPGATFSLRGPIDDVLGSSWHFQEYSYGADEPYGLLLA